MRRMVVLLCVACLAVVAWTMLAVPRSRQADAIGGGCGMGCHGHAARRRFVMAAVGVTVAITRFGQRSQVLAARQTEGTLVF